MNKRYVITKKTRNVCVWLLDSDRFQLMVNEQQRCESGPYSRTETVRPRRTDIEKTDLHMMHQELRELHPG